MRLDPDLSQNLHDMLGAIDAERMLAECARISSEVRLSGSIEELRALEYIASRLREFGFAVRLLRHPGYVSWPGPASLRVTGLGEVECITHAMAAPTSGTEGALVDAGELSGSLQGLLGRIALIDGIATPGRVAQAEAAGAIGEVFISPDTPHEMIVSPVWGNPTPQDLQRLPRTPSVTISREGGLRLRAHLAQGACDARLATAVTTRWRELPLLEADLAAGEGGFVLLSGHIDSWHLGAMDNGSANALMLEAACLLALHRERLQRGLRLCFWSGHSHGRYAGSAWYADARHFELDRSCLAHVNVDSPGGQGAMDLTNAIASAELRELGAVALAPESDQPYKAPRPMRAGDQSFLGFGVPSLFMEVSEQPPAAASQSSGVSAGGGLGWWWHTPMDTMDRLDPALLVRDTRIYLRGLWGLLTERVLPLRAHDAAQEVLSGLEEHAGLAGGRLDFAPALAAAEHLCRAARDLDAAADHLRTMGAQAPPGDLQQVNERLRGLSRSLGPIRDSASGPFGQDPALPQGLLPGLSPVRQLAALPSADPMTLHLTVQLQRELNRVVAALLAARAAVA